MIQKTALSFYRTVVLVGLGFAGGVVATSYAASSLIKTKYPDAFKKDKPAEEPKTTTD